MELIIVNRILYIFVAFIAYVSIHFGINLKSNYYILLILTLPFIFFILKNKKKIKKEKALIKIRSDWSKSVDRKRNFENLSKIFNKIKKQNDNEYIVNDQTWQDLNMDKMFSDIDRTITNCGENVLYKILRTIILDKDMLFKRNTLIKYFSENKKMRERIQAILYNLEWRKREDSLEIITSEISYKENMRKLSNIMRIISTLSLVLIKFIGAKYIFIALALFLINSYIIKKTENELLVYKSSIKTIRNMVLTGKELCNIKEPILEEYRDKLKISVDKCERIVKNTKNLFIVDNDPMGISIYIKTFFLLEINSFYNSVKNINDLKYELKNIYMIVGEIDALISIVSYRDGLKTFTEPILNEDKSLEIEDIIHPLVENPISNSIKTENNSIIITGSNMSGKSTFLRTLAINALLAQTIFITHAKYYKGSIFRIMTSISRNDNLNEGKSYYLREAELLLDMIKNLDDIPSLIIIDEIFRGTNTIERIEASSRILKYFSENNALVVVATHDLELNDLVNNTFESYHFSEKVGEGGLEFDYTLKKGVSNTRNAIKILKYLNYPEEITIDL